MILENPIESAWNKFEGLERVLLGQPLDMIAFDKDLAKRSIPFSDVNASDLITNAVKDVVCYVEKQKTWYVWNGIVHTPLDNASSVMDLVERFAHLMDDVTDFVKEWYAAAIRADIAANGNNSPSAKRLQDELHKSMFFKAQNYCDRLHNQAGQLSLFTMVTRKLTVDATHFEEDSQYLVFENGVLDVKALRTGGGWQIHKHSETRHVTRYFKAEYKGANTPQSLDWEHNFLNKSLPDPEVQRFLQKIIGCAFMGQPKLKVIPNLSGPKNSGKSLIVSVFNRLGGGGAGYSGMPSPAALLQDGDFSARDELRGRRFIAITEPDPDKKLDAEFVKQVSGGDQMSTRQLYGAYTSWMPECVMFIASNQPVRFNTWDDALLDRVALINFPNEFHPKEDGGSSEYWIDPGLEDRIVNDHASAVLKWVIEGMIMYLNEGLVQPKSVKSNRESAREESTQTYRWLKEWIDQGRIIELSEDEITSAGLKASSFVEYPAMYKLFKHVSEEGGERAISMRRFGQDLEKKYGKRVRSGVDRVPRLIWGENAFNDIPIYIIPESQQKSPGGFISRM